MVYTVTDADTGNEIVMFYRRGRPYIFLRDPETKRFVKQLNKIELRYYEEVNYSRDQARRKNPIYADFVALLQVKPEEIDQLGELEEELREYLELWITEKFGGVVELTEERGFEYGSKIKSRTSEEYIYFRGIRADTKNDLYSWRVREYEGATPKY